MRRKIALLLAVIICASALFACGGNKPTTEPTDTTAATQDETAAETVSVTVTPTTQPLPSTAVPVTEAVFYPPSGNKPSSDEDLSENTSKRPSKPQYDASGDEIISTRPSHDTSDTRYKYIAFTFDDGPHYELTYKFVDKLSEYGGVATFFVVGNRVSGKAADAVKYAYDMGNEIGVHGYTHTVYYDTCSYKTFRNEIDKTAKVIENVTGERPLTMRPFGGSITSSRVKDSGYAVIIWNVDSNDWRYVGSGTGGVNQIVNNVLSSTDEGDIILMHEIYYDSYKAFCKIIDKLYKKGYRFVTVSQLLNLTEEDRGTLYYNAY